MFEIEKDIPIPAVRDGRRKYPLVQLEVGESFVVPVEIVQKVKWVAASSRPKKFVSAVIDEKHVRFWRVK